MLPFFSVKKAKPQEELFTNDHWCMKGWYRFLDPKFKTFSRLFSKTIISFFRFKFKKYVINRDVAEGRNQPFFMMQAIVQYPYVNIREFWNFSFCDWMSWQIWQWEKHFSYWALFVALKQRNPSNCYRVAWKFCGFKFLRILRIDLDPQKLVPVEKKNRKIKRCKN